MNNPLLVDEFEPVELEKLLAQSISTVTRVPLNRNNFADYMWCCVDNHNIQLERKQWAELLSEFSEIEEQIRKYMNSTEEMGLIVEGVLLPHQLGCETWKIEHGGYVRNKRVFKRPYAEVMAWLWQIDKEGITVYYTPHQRATASAIAAFYNNSQKEEHTTLRRYIKAKSAAWQPDIHVQNLINLRGPGLRIGEKTAIALKDMFGTYWGVVTRSKEELCECEGVGLRTAEALLRAIGREV